MSEENADSFSNELLALGKEFAEISIELLAMTGNGQIDSSRFSELARRVNDAEVKTRNLHFRHQLFEFE